MNKKYYIVCLLFMSHTQSFYAMARSSLAKSYAITATGLGATVTSVYLGGRASQVKFDFDATKKLVQQDAQKTIQDLQDTRHKFVTKEMEVHTIIKKSITKEYETLHARIKKIMEKIRKE